MTRRVRVVAASAPGLVHGSDGGRPTIQLTDLSSALTAALGGTGPAVLAVPHGLDDVADAAPRSAIDAGVPADVALVVRTSGSTGAPRAVLLSAEALRTSADATADRLGGHGRWLLALPATHIAGLQVLARSVLAGTRPVALAPGPFRAPDFAAATDELVGTNPHNHRDSAERRYTSLVPTQLRRLLADPHGVWALRAYDAVLVGGAATAPALVDDARAAGISIVTTYGMSETCGGCVYDGRPLDGMTVEVEPDGRILLAGPMLATGYLGRPDLDEETFVDRAGVRWLRTSDAGSVHTRGPSGTVLTVLGRLDDMLVSGGVKVAPAAVERLVAQVPGIAEVCVVGIPDAEWGQAVTAVVVLADDAPTPRLTQVRSAVARTLGPACAPRHLVVVGSIPVRGPGKPDRHAVVELAITAISQPAAPAPPDDRAPGRGTDRPAVDGRPGDRPYGLR